MLRAAELLDAGHDLTAFASGTTTLDEWLKKRALGNQNLGASRTYVACDDRTVVAYYALAAGSILHSEATGKLKRNMPDPIPAMVLARLAVDQSWQGRGLGADMLGDAVKRTLQAAQIAGVRAMVVDAISEDAAKFYERWGFVRSTAMPMRLMARITDLVGALGHLP